MAELYPTPLSILICRGKSTCQNLPKFMVEFETGPPVPVCGVHKPRSRVPAQKNPPSGGSQSKRTL